MGNRTGGTGRGQWAAGVGLAVAAIILVFAGCRRGNAGGAEQQSGPEIKLIAIRPDAREEWYGADGKKIITEALPHHGGDNWGAANMAREFVFEVEETDEAVVFVPGVRIDLAGGGRRLGLAGHGGMIDFNGRKLLLCRSTLPRYSESRLFGVLRRSRRVGAVDVTVRYYYGAPRAGELAFRGPFAEGAVVQSSDGSYTVMPEEDVWGNAVFVLSTSKQMWFEEHGIACDKAGKLHLLEGAGGRYRGEGISLHDIVAVDFGKEVCEKVFRNVVVDYGGVPDRDHAEYLDEMAARLGVAAEPMGQWVSSPLGSAEDVLKVIDVVGGLHIKMAVDKLKHSIVDVSKLPEDTEARIRATAERWTESPLWRVRYAGVRLGVIAGQGEFTNKALDLLLADQTSGHGVEMAYCRNSNAELASTLGMFAKKLSGEQLEKIERIILTTGNDSVRRSLYRCLYPTRVPECTEMLVRLGGDDRTWVWWQAIERVYGRGVRYEELTDMGEEVKARVFLVMRGRIDGMPKEAAEGLKAEARKMLPGMFTVELLERDQAICDAVRERICSYMGREEAVELFVRFAGDLRPAVGKAPHGLWMSMSDSRWWPLYRAVRTINLWYGVNLGGLGGPRDEDELRGMPRTVTQALALIDEVVEWHEKGEKVAAEIPLEGWVKDSQGTLVAGAIVTIQRREGAGVVGTCTTDAGGRFVFGDVEDGSEYMLTAAAEGVGESRVRYVVRLPDGRLIFDRGNVVVLEEVKRAGGGR